MLLGFWMLEVEAELHHRHRGDGGLCPLGCVKAPSEQSPWECSSSSSPVPSALSSAPCTCRALVRAWGEAQMQGGSCAGLALQGCRCNSFIYTHNRFTTSGQSFIPCMGRFGLQRDISTRASGNYERALYVRAALLVASAQPWVFHPLGSERSPCHELCSECCLCPGSHCCSHCCHQGDGEGGTGPLEPICSCAKAKLGSVLFGCSALGL